MMHEFNRLLWSLLVIGLISGCNSWMTYDSIQDNIVIDFSMRFSEQYVKDMESADAVKKMHMIMYNNNCKKLIEFGKPRYPLLFKNVLLCKDQNAFQKKINQTVVLSIYVPVILFANPLTLECRAQLQQQLASSFGTALGAEFGFGNAKVEISVRNGVHKTKRQSAEFGLYRGNVKVYTQSLKHDINDIVDRELYNWLTSGTYMTSLLKVLEIRLSYRRGDFKLYLIWDINNEYWETKTDTDKISENMEEYFSKSKNEFTLKNLYFNFAIDQYIYKDETSDSSTLKLPAVCAA